MFVDDYYCMIQTNKGKCERSITGLYETNFQTDAEPHFIQLKIIYYSKKGNIKCFTFYKFRIVDMSLNSEKKSNRLISQ